MTITLSEERQRALKEVATRRGMSITALIDESLELAGVRSLESARRILARAGAGSGLGEDAAMVLALEETARERAGRA
jgi:hypothetical protein